MIAAIITLTKFDTRNIAIPIAELGILRDHRLSGIRIASRRLHRELAFQPHIRFPHPTRHGRPALPVASTRNFGLDPQATVHSRFTRSTRIPQASESE